MAGLAPAITVFAVNSFGRILPSTAMAGESFNGFL